MAANSLPTVVGNPMELFRQYKDAGNEPKGFALFVGSVGRRVHVIMPEVSDQGRGERMHLVHFDLPEIDGMVRARIVSTADRIAQIQGVTV